MAGADHRHLLAIAGTGWRCLVQRPLSIRGLFRSSRPPDQPHSGLFDPYSDRTGAGWNVIQSMIAIGSGDSLARDFSRELKPS